jgi:transcriptional regulator with XRE-family HTH domain
MTPARRLATVLRDLRGQKGITQQELARSARVTRSYIAVLEAGHRKNPSLAILRRLARALGVPVSVLLDEPAPPKRKGGGPETA